MSWFDEQIRERIESDNNIFEDALLKAAGVVMGRRLTAAMNDNRQATTDAIGEILRFYHVKGREVPSTVTGLDDTLEYLLRPHGIMCRTVAFTDGWYRDAYGAMLGVRRDDGTAVALIPSGLSRYTFYDTATDRRVTVGRNNHDIIDSEALVFYMPFPASKIGIRGMISYILSNITIHDIVPVIVAAAIVMLTGLLNPYLTRMMFSDVLMSGRTGALLALTVFMASVSIGLVLFNTIRSMLVERLSLKLGLSVEAASMMRVLSLPASFFKEYGSGELASRTETVQSLVSLLLNMILSVGLTALFSLTYITQITHYAPALVWPALAVAVSTMVISLVAGFMQARITEQHMEAASKTRGFGYALITGIQKIRLSGSERRAFAKWGNLYTSEAKLVYDIPVFLKVNSAIIMAISLIGTAIIYIAAIGGNVSVAEYYAFNTAYGMISAAFTSLGGIALMSANIKPILDMARPILDVVPEVAEDKEVIEKLSGNIELNNVTFSYGEGQPDILSDLSLKIKAGQYVAIVGRTGCGKSTLLRILLGFETPRKGAVYYDGKDISRIDLKSLRRHIGTVLQNGKLFTDSIYANIVINDPRLTLDEAWEAARMAGLAEDIEAMPMGMFTLLGEGGGISGGQKQRLLIARAIAPKPKVLFFDEATSALDNITQKTVSESLDKLKCTRVVIAHRLSTIKQCDRIIMLENGGIVEDGTYEELMNLNGKFAELVARQQVDPV